VKNRVLRALMREGSLNDEQVQSVRLSSKETGLSFDKILREKELVTEEKMLEVFHKVTRFPYERDLSKFQIPEEFMERINSTAARSFGMVGIGYHDGVYHVATNEPLNIHAMDQLAGQLEAETETVLSSRSEILSLLNRSYNQGIGSVDIDGIDDGDFITINEDDGNVDLLDPDKGPIVKMVNTIIFECYRMRASDIHFQPQEQHLLVRGRIDGILYDRQIIPKKFQDAVLVRLKVMSKMDIAERRLPQDGRASVSIGDSEIDIRFNSVPTNYGERIVLRLLDKTDKVYDLDDIGLAKADHALINKLIGFQHGIVLVTGPTGSGKTTTLYAVLSKIDNSVKNVITIEDPIEYHLGGISQIQVSNKKGLSFDKGLRALLRQDPDVMMIGEIRDGETAKIAIQAALTGHLVFSTLHTNDSASSVTRLLDIGVEPYLVASSVICVIAQRLVRVICKECKSLYEPTAEELRDIGLTLADLPDRQIAVGMGCSFCFETGYVGRTAIYEILTITEAVREGVLARQGAATIKDKAMAQGLKTLRMDGARKVIEGLTTVEEVLRVTQLDLS
jgi:general secretion pathway protein E